jgi:hypothetical protein
VSLPSFLFWSAECRVALGVSVQLQGFDSDSAADGVAGVAVPMQQGVHLVGAQESLKYALASQRGCKWNHSACRHKIKLSTIIVTNHNEAILEVVKLSNSFELDQVPSFNLSNSLGKLNFR